MKKILLAVLFIGYLLSSCGSVPVSGRRQLSLVGDQEVLSLSLQEYDSFIKTADLSSDQKNTELVRRVGRNIANAVETWLKNNGHADEVKNYSWEFNLVKSSDVNAFCMPGGKIVVYEGILPVTQNEVGLAVVIGHEVAHAVAKHANERMSQQVLTQGGATILDMTAKNEIYNQAFGAASQYLFLLPYSRKHETEADELGLVFMSMAGYDPREAPAFWQRMSQTGGGSVPEFLSTHPSDETRVKNLEKYMPKALNYYKGAGGASSAKSSSQWSF